MYRCRELVALVGTVQCRRIRFGSPRDRVTGHRFRVTRKHDADPARGDDCQRHTASISDRRRRKVPEGQLRIPLRTIPNRIEAIVPVGERTSRS